MRSGRVLAVAVAVLLSAGAMGTALSAAAAAGADPSPSPTPTSTGTSQVGFTVGTPSPTPTPSPSSSTGTGGGGGHGGGGSGGSGGGTGTTPPACVPTTKTPTPAPNPEPSPAPLHVSAHTLSQGGDVLLTAAGFQAGEKVLVTLYSSPVKLGVFTVRTNGQVYADVTIPKRTQLGSHVIQVTGFQDCRVVAADISVVSPHGSGSSVFPWIVWVVAGGGVGIAALGVLLAFLLGWLPAGFALGGASRVAP